MTAAALPRQRRRRWRPPNLREQQAIRRCSWALLTAALMITVNAAWGKSSYAWVLGISLGVVFWRLLGLEGILRLREPRIVLRYLRTCWTDE